MLQGALDPLVTTHWALNWVGASIYSDEERIYFKSMQKQQATTEVQFLVHTLH